MKGRVIALGHWGASKAAALLVDGRLSDLLIDPVDETRPHPGAIYRARAVRPLKGQNGMIVDLGDGATGLLRNAKGIAPGQGLLVQIVSEAGENKAAPATSRLLFKGRNVILTPGARGINLSRAIRDEERRVTLLEIAHETLQDAPDGLGLILRSAAEIADPADLVDEIGELRALCDDILTEPTDGAPGQLMAAPSAHYLAWRDWSIPAPDLVDEGPDAFQNHGVLDMIDALGSSRVSLGTWGHMFVEQTRALVAVDVNTGGDFSYSAGLKANLAAAQDLPRQLRLRGLGGQIVIDFAPMGKKDRRQVEQALSRALRQDPVETVRVGWTPLGHLELQRKRERAPLGEVLARGE